MWIAEVSIPHSFFYSPDPILMVLLEVGSGVVALGALSAAWLQFGLVEVEGLVVLAPSSPPAL